MGKVDLSELIQADKSALELTDDEVEEELGFKDESTPVAESTPESMPEEHMTLPDDDTQPQPRRRRVGNRSESNIATYEELDQLIDEMDPGSTKKVYMTITRVEPSHYAGQRIEGYICKYSHKTNIDEIKQMHGGGTYDIRFFGPRRNGRGNELLTSRRIVISGDPIIKQQNNAVNQTSVEAQIVKDAMNTQKDVLARMEEKNRQDQQSMISMVKEITSGKGNDSEMMKILVGMFQTMAEQQRAQIEIMREEAKRDRELILQREREREAENRRLQEKHQEELRQIRAESEKIKQLTSNDMMSFIKEMSKENAARAESTTKQLQALSEIQLKMVMENNKAQADMILSENKRLSDELKESRLSSKTDLSSELKKMATVLNMMDDFKNLREGEPASIADKISDHLPDIIERAPDIIESLGTLFRGRRENAPPRPPPSMPRRRLMPPARRDIPQPQRNEDPQAQAKNQHEQPNDQMKEAVEAQEKIIKLKQQAEQAITEGIDPASFFENNIKGKYDKNFLQKVALAPPSMLISAMGQMFGQDGPMFTVKGKDFMHDLHRIVRESLAG